MFKCGGNIVCDDMENIMPISVSSLHKKFNAKTNNISFNYRRVKFTYFFF